MERVVEDGSYLEKVLQFGHGRDRIEAELLAVDDGQLLRREVEQPPVQVVSVHAGTEAPHPDIPHGFGLPVASSEHLVERVVERCGIAVRAHVLIPTVRPLCRRYEYRDLYKKPLSFWKISVDQGVCTSLALGRSACTRLGTSSPSK